MGAFTFLGVRVQKNASVLKKFKDRVLMSNDAQNP